MRRILTSVALLVCLSSPLFAAGLNFTWTSGSGTSSWSTGGNWSGGTGPDPFPDADGAGTDTVTVNNVGSAIYPQLNIGSGSVTIASLTISGSAANISLNGFSLTVTGNASLGVGNTPAAISNASGSTVSFSVGGTTTLTANVLIQASGAGSAINVTFAGAMNATTAGTQALTVLAQGGLINFTPGATIGLGTSLGSLVLNSSNPSNSAITIESATTSGNQAYQGRVTVGGATTLTTSNSTVQFTNVVNGAQSLTVSAGTSTVTFGNSVGNVTPLTSLTVSASSSTSLRAVTTSGAQSYTATTATTLGGTLAVNTAGAGVAFTGPVSLGAGSGTIALTGTSAGNTVSFSGTSTVDGNRPLLITAGGGAVAFAPGAVIGGSTPPASVTVTASATTSLQAVTTSGAQSYTSTAGTTLAGTLLVNTQGAGVTVSGPTTLAAGGGTITLTGSNAGNDVSMGSVDGAQPLAITAGGGSATLGPVGGTTPVSSVAIGGTGAPTINLQAVTTTGAQSYTGATTLNGNLTSTTSGTIAVSGSVSLATGAIAVTGAGAAGNNISFSSTINGAQALTVNAGAATVSLGGAVGGTTPLSSLSVTSTNAAVNAITMQSVVTTGAQGYSGNVTLAANATVTTTNSNVTFSGTVNATSAGGQSLSVTKGSGTLTFGGMVGGAVALASLSVDAGGAVDMNGGGVTTSTAAGGTQTYGGPIVLGADTTLTGYSGSFGGSISGNGYSLTLNFTTATTINGTTFSGLNNFTSNGPIQLSGTISTAGSQSYNSTAQLIGNATLTASAASSSVAFASTLDGSAPGWTLTISAGTSAGGTASFASTVGATNALGAMSLTANTITFVGGAGSVHGNSTLLLQPASASSSVGVAGGAGTLQVTAADVNALAAGFSQIQIGQPLGTAPVTVGAAGVTFTSPVLLQSNGAGGSVVLDGSVSAGANAVTITAGAIDLNYPAGSGNAVTTAGAAIALNGPVTLTANTSLASGGGNISASSTVNSQAATNYSLSLTAGAGAVSVGGAIGGATPLSTVTVASASTIGLLAVTTTAAQSYTASTSTTLAGTLTVNAAGAGVAFSGPVALAAGGGTITLTGTNAGNTVSFSGTSTVDGARALVITAAGGAVSFAAGAVVGGTTPLASVTVAASATTSLQAVTTSGAQSYTAATSTTLAGTLTVNAAGAGVAFSGPVALAAGGGAITLTGTSAGNTVSFGGTSTVNGAQALAITAGGGAVSFAAGAVVGGTTPLASVTVAASATTSLQAVTTSGAQSYTATTGTTLNGNVTSTASGTIAVNGAVTLATGAITVTGAGASGDNISFSSTVDGAQALTVSAGAAAASFGGAIGGTTSLSSLGVTSTSAAANAITIQSVTTSGSQTYTGNVTLGATTTTLQTTNSSVSWSGTVNATVAGAQSLTLVLGTGTATAGGSIGGTTAIGNLTISSGSLSMGANSITLQGNWTNSAGATGFSAGTGTVSFVGAAAETLASGGASFNNLTISGGTAVTVQTNALTVSGQLTISGNTDSINLQSQSFTINSLSFGAVGNTGTFYLSGAQSGSSTITSYAQTSGGLPAAGVIELQGTPNATFPGTLPTAFYDLTINGQTAGTTYTLTSSITVVSTLTIQAGVLDASTSNYGITVEGTWTNNVGAAGFTPRGGTVTFSGGTSAYNVNGSTNFFDFTCTTAGATITIQAGATEAILPGGNFHITGASGNPVTLEANPTHTSTTTPSPQWSFYLEPGPPAATLTMSYVTVYDSDASANPISTPANVTVGTTPPTIYNDTDWFLQDLVIAGQTQDLNRDGKIDALLVTVQTNIESPPNFAGFQASVSGYTVTGYAAGPAQNQFYIDLSERPSLDSDATPTWSIVSNSTLVDAATGIHLVAIASPPAATTDSANPVIAYTLAVAGQSQVFVAFSEPVVQSGGAALAAGNFTIPGYTVSSITPVVTSGAGMKQLLLNVSPAIAVNDIIDQTDISTSGTIVDMSPAANPLWGPGGATPVVHRISDIGLGLPGQGIVEPIWAKDQSQVDPLRGGAGIIHTFDGSAWLQAQTITLQSYITDADTSATNPAATMSVSVYFDAGVSSSLTTGSLWLPPFNESQLATAGFSGIVPYADSAAHTVSTLADTPNVHIRDSAIPSSDSLIKSGTTLQFFYEIAPVAPATEPLVCAALPNPSASNWYQLVQPWAFKLQNITTQRGNVTILHNVINPNYGEHTNLEYTLTQGGIVTINVFDLAGDLVNTLYSGQRSPGQYSTSWDGRNFSGQVVARGIYFIRVVAPGVDEFRKVLVVK